jgi:hypothetical protein
MVLGLGERRRNRERCRRRLEGLSHAMEAWFDDGVLQLVEKLRSVGQHDNTLYSRP